MLTYFGIAILLTASYLLEVKCGGMFPSCGCKQQCSDCEQNIRTEAGWVRGLVREAEDGSKYVSFRGIPYGKPPLGRRRFKELEPVDPWCDFTVYNAYEDKHACPQYDVIYGRFKHQPMGQSEDCIYLNLHVPCHAVPKKPVAWHDTIHRGLPILVFIHEGAFQSGSGLTDFTGPEYIMTTKRVILISFNYRINVFGFLCLNCKEIPGNQGLRDQVTLLRWVRRNARGFGGDPENVTLMGHSGGGTSAHLLSLSKATKGLFKRIIVLSCNAIPTYYTASPVYAKDVANRFLKELGINDTDPVVIHKKLVEMPLYKIMAANSIAQYHSGFVLFCPVIETKQYPGITRVMDEDPLSLIAMGRALEYPTLMGFTSNEMGFSKLMLLQKGLVPLVRQDHTAIVSLRHIYSLPRAEVVKIGNMIDARYLHGNPTPLEELMQYYTDMYFKHTGLKWAEWRAALGGAPLYMYQFAYESKDSLVKQGFWADYKGAAHFDDHVCIFRVNSVLGDYHCHPPKNDDDNMKFYMVDMITNFMYCSNPTCDKENYLWPPVSKRKILYNLITVPFSIDMREPTPKENDIVNFFDSFDPHVRNISALLANQQFAKGRVPL